MTEYTEKQRIEIGRYINLYAEMQKAASTLQSAKQLHDSSPESWGANFKSPITEFAKRLRGAIEVYRSEVPYLIRQKVTRGPTPNQLETLATNILLELGE